MRRIEAGSYYSYLPEGCKLCRKGAKLVLFVTGLCNNRCFYCPVSKAKFGSDVIYANEREVKSAKDFLEEADLMGAEGIAVTGGEPLLKLERVREFVSIAKKLDMHVHLYTAIPADEEKLRKLSAVDEIRFHPPELMNPDAYVEPIKTSKKLGMDAGFEIPAVRFEKRIVEIVNETDAFLNVNQLEVSESNWKHVVERGYRVKDYYVENQDVVREYEKANKFHYCSARFKDVAQFRRRLIRMAMNHPEFYAVTRDGTIICCRIEGDLDLAERILSKWEVEYLRFEEYIETSPDIEVEIREALKSEGLKLSLVERYPTSNRLVVELTEI
ncbi:MULTISPECIES: radical SAM protein [unclassified Archaeoglobus]|jgi:hypothetical protein|uniref:radical SAM protein n=1 Tax=unclassified Archaeoglobus TaxID=2643606 RepID=UPI0025C276D5|nr:MULTISPECIES: radical SAM protein [unclassified Archaeoglobus]